MLMVVRVAVMVEVAVGELFAEHPLCVTQPNNDKLIFGHKKERPSTPSTLVAVLKEKVLNALVLCSF